MSDETTARSGVRRRIGGPTWDERCAHLFLEMRKPATAMIARAYGKSMADADIEDIYSSAWTSVLNALRKRGEAMDEGELRTYLLTAVATHASKELRRRGRKRVAPLEPSAETVLATPHEPSPEERAIGSEQRAVARDLLMGLPERRRAVLLLRYGGGLSPAEVCSRIEGLSPRAYRKEVTRGIDAMIEGLEQAETGALCEKRRRVLRDLASGVADSSQRREAELHLAHCRSCAQAHARLELQVNEMGVLLVLLGGVDAVIWPAATLSERLFALSGEARDALVSAGERVHEQLLGIAVAGGTGGAGTMGAGVIAKAVAAGAATKAAIVCAGAGAAAGACIAAGFVPGVVGSEGGDRVTAPPKRAESIPRSAAGSTPVTDSTARVEGSPTRRISDKGTRSGSADASAGEQREERTRSTVPGVPTQAAAEFDPLAQAPPPHPAAPPEAVATLAPDAQGSGSADPASMGGSGRDTTESKSVAREEFGP